MTDTISTRSTPTCTTIEAFFTPTTALLQQAETDTMALAALGSAASRFVESAQTAIGGAPAHAKSMHKEVSRWGQRSSSSSSSSIMAVEQKNQLTDPCALNRSAFNRSLFILSRAVEEARFRRHTLTMEVCGTIEAGLSSMNSRRSFKPQETSPTW